MQRFPSMDNIVPQRAAAVSNGNSRRTASWSGSLSDASSLSTKPLGEAPGIPSSFYADTNSGEDLREIKL